MRIGVRWITLFLTASRLFAASPIRTILVIPFENQSARADVNWISESFAEVLSLRLASSERYVLGREERTTAFAQMGVPPQTPLTLASCYKAAETLGVEWLVVGSFSVEGDHLSARARLLDMRRMKLAPAVEVTGELTDLIDLQTELAWRLLAAHAPDFVVGKVEDFQRQFRPVRLDAFENYIRGVLAEDDESRVRYHCEADRLDASDHRAAFELGRYYFDKKDYENSAKWFRKLEEADPNYLGALFRQGVDEFFLGHDAAAEKAFETLSWLIPLGEVRNNLGVMKARRGQHQEALADFERASQANPTDKDISFNLAACLWHLNQYDKVARVLEESLRLNGEDVEAHTLRAAALGKLGDSAGQSAELRWLDGYEGDAGASPNGDFVPQVRLKKAYDGRAFRVLSLAVRNAQEGKLANETTARYAAARLAQGRKFLAEGRLPEAERELSEAMTLLPQDSEAHLLLAQVYEARGRHREAVSELESSLRLKNSVVAHLWLARVYLSLDRPEAARPHGQAALRLDPGNRDAAQLVDQIRARTAGRGKTP